jgi:hypothetical protein
MHGPLNVKFIKLYNLYKLYPYREHLALKKVATKHQQQIFQLRRKAILLLCLILNM